MRLHNARVPRRRLGNLGALGDWNLTQLVAAAIPQTQPPPPPPPTAAPAPAPADTAVVAIAPSGAPVVATTPAPADTASTLSPPAAAVAAALPATAPGAGPIAAPAPAPAGIATMPPIVGTGPASTSALPPTYWTGGAQDRVEVQPTWDQYLSNAQWGYVQGLWVPVNTAEVQRLSTIAPKATFDKYFSASALQARTQAFIDYHPSEDSFTHFVGQVTPILATGALAFMGGAALAAPAAGTAAAAAPEYLTAAEVAPAAEAATVAAPAASATLPEAALSTVYTAPIPETVISELPAGLTPDALAVSSPVAAEGTAASVSIAPAGAPEYLLPQEVMPAAVPETPATLSEWGLTETAPGVFEAAPASFDAALIPESELAPVPEEVITPTTPAGEAGVPSTWYAGAAPSGGVAAPGGVSEAGSPGASGGGGSLPSVPNQLVSALERFFTGKPAVPVATHPQTLLEAAGEYAQANPLTGFALALAIGAGIIGARAMIKR